MTATDSTRRAGHELGVRFVAATEALKGLIALLIGVGVLSLLHRNVAQLGEELARHLHLNPAKNHPGIFVHALAGIHDAQLLLIAAGAAGYAIFRLVLATVLWRSKSWAEWLAALGAGIYIPFEVYELARAVTPLRIGTFVCNVLVVAILVRTLQRRGAEEGAQALLNTPWSRKWRVCSATSADHTRPVWDVATTR